MSEMKNKKSGVKSFIKKILEVKDDNMPKSIARGKYRFVFCMSIVAIAHFVIFYIGVNYKSISLAFQKISTAAGESIIGYEFTFDNFARFFREMTYSDSILPTAFLNTFKYFILSTFILFPFSYFISYFLYKKIWGYMVFRVIFYLTSIISGVILVGLYRNFIKIEGPLYLILKKLFGYQMPSLLTSEGTATGAIMGYVVWTGLAGNFILFGGAMNRIPAELIEAGKIDGCNWVREFYSIVTPLCWDTVATLFILSFIGIFQSSGPILLFNGDSYTWTLSHWIYMQVTQGSFSFPAAVGLLLTVISLPLVFLVRKLLNKVNANVEY